MSKWLLPDRIEYLYCPCITLRKLYGGIFKDQRRHFQEIPKGTEGIARQRITEGDTNTTFVLCTFRVDNKRLWVRCVAEAIELKPPV